MSGERGPLPSPLPSCQPVLAVQLPISSLHNQPRWKANVSLPLFKASDFKMFSLSVHLWKRRGGTEWKRERSLPVSLSLSLSGIQHLVHSSQLLVLSGKSQGQIAHIRHDYCNRLPPSSARWQFPSPALGFWLPKHASGSFYRHWLSADSRWN